MACKNRSAKVVVLRRSVGSPDAVHAEELRIRFQSSRTGAANAADRKRPARGELRPPTVVLLQALNIVIGRPRLQ